MSDYCELKNLYCTASTYYQCNKADCSKGYGKKYTGGLRYR